MVVRTPLVVGLADEIVAIVIELDPQHLHGGHTADITLQEVLEERRAPAAHHHHTLLVLGGMEVTDRRSDVPDDDARGDEGNAPHILARALERLADHLDVRLPRLRLHHMAVTVTSVVARLARATCLIPAHVGDDDEVLGLLPRANAIRLEVREHKIHRLLEVGGRPLTCPAVVQLVHARDDVRTCGETVEDRVAVEGQERVLELVRRDLRDEQTHRHADPVGRRAVASRGLHRPAEVAHRERASETARVTSSLDQTHPLRDHAVALILGHSTIARVGDLLDELVREDDVLRLRHNLALLRLLEEGLEVLTTRHTTCVIRMTERTVLDASILLRAGLVEVRLDVLLEGAPRNVGGGNVLEVICAHHRLHRLEVSVDGHDHLAIRHHPYRRASHLGEELARDVLGEAILTSLTRNPLRKKADLVLGIRSNSILADLIDSHLDNVVVERGIDTRVLCQLEEVAPAAILGDELEHMERELWAAAVHPLPHKLARGTLTLPAANVAVLEEQDPHVLESLIVAIHSLLPDGIQVLVDDRLGHAADEKSVEGDARITHTVRGVDVAALHASLRQIVHVGVGTHLVLKSCM